jgi:enoyl-CoA hydratase/carnithine racemase
MATVASDAGLVNLIVAESGSAVRITLNRPDKRNALSLELMRELHGVLTSVGERTDVRAVILEGAGAAFSAGHDLSEMVGRDLPFYQGLFDTCVEVMETIHKVPQPVIAKVRGIATAAGCQLVAACDLAVAASTARFAVSGINFGLFCSTPSVALSRNLTRKAAFEMLVTGDFISAEDAKAKGLVNRVAAPEAIDAEVEALVAAIVAKPRVAVAMGKQLFYRQLEVGVEAAYEDAGRTMACNMMDEAALEGVQAFIDKRKPAWAP